MRVLPITGTAVNLAAQKVPFLANYTVAIFNTTAGSLTLQHSADNSTWATLKVLGTGEIAEVTFDRQYVKVSTAATLYAVGN
jgi:hypothetical protein